MTTLVAPPATRTLHRLWLGPLAAWALVMCALLLLYRHDVAHIVGLWWRTDTFGHCLLIPPILAWLTWQRRNELAQLVPCPWLPAALLLLALGLVWMAGEVAGVALVRHGAVVLSLIASVPLVFGLTVARGLTFVLFFALFMVPAGEELVPLLQTITADFSMVMLDLFQVPAYNDGVLISTPTGNFEVAEACSGVRFLIAMIAFGVLTAHLCFKSWTRRIIFVVSAILLSILANGIRAWGTIYIAHLTTPEFARGVDHVFYGWIFFAIVMGLLLAVGWRFFDRPVDDPAFDPRLLQPHAPAPARAASLGVAAAIGLAAAAAGPAYATYIAQRAPDSRTAAIDIAPPPGWRATAFSGLDWKPNYKGASAEQLRSFVNQAGQRVDVYVAVFDKQDETHELVGYQQGVLPLGDLWSWAGNDPAVRGARTFRIGTSATTREVWQYYLVNGRVVASPVDAKVEGLKARLFGGPSLAATLVVSAERADRNTSVRGDIARFMGDAGSPDRIILTAVRE